jgi:hypothetical protein
MGKDLEWNGRNPFEVLSRNFPVGTEENHETKQASRYTSRIRTKHIPNTSLDRYRYTVCSVFHVGKKAD